VRFEGWGISMKKIAVALTALALMSASAQAADLILDTPDVEYGGAFHDWSGFYAGVMGGGGVGTGISTSTLTGTATNFGIAGGLLGGNLGYNHQIDNFVLGAEGELLGPASVEPQPATTRPLHAVAT
jgi:outer membrane immunogenic protein